MDKALKQRLVGATVLVALAVVILPMLLGGQPESPQEARQIDIPERPQELSFETRRFPIGEPVTGEPSVVPELPPANPRAVEMTTPSPTSQKPEREASDSLQGTPQTPENGDAGIAATATPDQTSGSGESVADTTTAESEGISIAEPEPVVPEPVNSQPAAAPGGRYLVQVASFSSLGNANRLAETLRASGLPVVMDSVESAAGTLRRVRVGPFEQAGRAEAVIVQLNRQLPDLRPRVVDLRPTDDAQVTEPEDPLIQWMVQVGSFAESGNAEQLVFQLRDAGFRASSVAVSDRSGTSYKVRVGPEVRRSDAVRLKDRLASEQGIDGLILSID